MGEGLKRAVAAAKRTWVCHWVRDDVDDSYDTDCGKKFQLSTTDTLHEHGMTRFTPRVLPMERRRL
jgi:hypothetical protein